MDRQGLLTEMIEATTPNETSTAIWEARNWLGDHPDDAKIASALEDLIEVEREAWG